ncbi:MAG: TIR domain-containing protein [Pseudanabaenales cyanobacterium]|nr:TIR domain-containing protein [Pseudanabaenales cyanobacterium]
MQPKYVLSGHRGLIPQVAFAPDGQWLASASFDAAIKIWSLETGELVQTLNGHQGRVWQVGYSPDGKFLASSSSDKTLRLWEIKQHSRHSTPEVLQKEILPEIGPFITMAWCPNQSVLAVGGDHDHPQILLWDVTTSNPVVLEGNPGQVGALIWSPDGRILASGSNDGAIRFWESETRQLQVKLQGHFAGVRSLCWSKEEQLLASGAADNTIRIWDTEKGKTLVVLEGHTGPVNSVSFLAKDRFIASKSADNTVRIWRCDTWEPVAIIAESTSNVWPFNLACHPTEPILATLGEDDTAIRIWEIEPNELSQVGPPPPSIHYKNAKVILVGDTGVGKSGLGLVLTGKAFQATESTHGRHVWTFDSLEESVSDKDKEIHEILLWDLAGQAGYRLIHQLHFNEIVVALIVFDARSETDPFSGVNYWNRALRQAQKLQGKSSTPLKKFLVSARADRGGIGVSEERIQALVKELEFDEYFETSAKEGLSIPKLKDAIRQAIEWENLPKVVSSQLFQKIKAFLFQKKKEGCLLSNTEDLYHTFLQSAQEEKREDLYESFRVCIDLVESRDLIRKLSFGNLVLLQPELLDAYASGILNSAKGGPDGFGSISEEDVKVGRFRMPDSERIENKGQEKLLLIATIEELLNRELALREATEIGDTLLVFPSQLTREWPEAPDPEGKEVIFEFEGAIQNIYTTLVIRLSRSDFFVLRKDKMWKNTVIYEATAGGKCGIWMRPIEEGKAELALFFREEVSDETKQQFEYYVYIHLNRRALPDSVKRRCIFVCPACNTPVTELMVKRRRERGFASLLCSVCETKISIEDVAESSEISSEHVSSVVPEIDQSADAKRKLETATSVLEGKVETHDYDVFLAHNSKDKREVANIAAELRKRGINPWLDKERIPPGRCIQDVIQEAIQKCRSVAIFFGTEAPGEFQMAEIKASIDLNIGSKKMPIIPVLLPGSSGVPDDLLFLKQYLWVKFHQHCPEEEAMDALVWGITGKKAN